MSDSKCAVCFIYPAQHGKVVCVKCDSMDFVPGDIAGNQEKARKHMAWVHVMVDKMFSDADSEGE